MMQVRPSNACLQTIEMGDGAVATRQGQPKLQEQRVIQDHLNQVVGGRSRSSEIEDSNVTVWVK